MSFKSILSNVTADITRFISKFARPEPIIVDADYNDIARMIKDGDCLVTRTEWELSNIMEKILTGSFYGHAAIYIGGMVYEASIHGVRKLSLAKFCFMKDGIGLGRLQGPDWTEEQLSDMVEFLEKQLGDEYDFSLSWGKMKKWYCSKLVYFAWQKGKPMDTKAMSVTHTLGTKEVTPQDIWNSVLKECTRGVKK